MPSRSYSAVPNLKVKRLTRLFESRPLSPRKIAMAAKDKEVKSRGSNSAKIGAKGEKEKAMNREQAKANPAVEAQGAKTGQQQQQPVVPQPRGAADQAGAVSGLMKRFLEKGAGAGSADRAQQKRKGEGTTETDREQPAKRNNREADEDQDEEEMINVSAGAGDLMGREGEDTRDKELRGMLEGFRIGAVSMDKIVESINNTINKRLAEQLKVFRKAATSVYEDRMEKERCARSVLIFNADKWQMSPDREDDVLGRRPLADRITEVIHTMTMMMVSVQDSHPMSKRENGQDPKLVRVVFGSSRQKSVFYRCVAAHMRRRTAIGNSMKLVSIRDCFPRDKIEAAKQKNMQGGQLKRDGRIASYRVVASGLECVPILEVKSKDATGRISRQWEIYNEGGRRTEHGQEQGDRWMTTGRRGAARPAPESLTYRLDPDELYRMDPLQAKALMDQERIRLEEQQREFDRRMDEEDWNNYEEPY